MGRSPRSLSAFAILISALPAAAQFDALPDSNATWTETFWIGPGFPMTGTFYEYDPIQPDTLIAGQVFQKLRALSSFGQYYYGGALLDNGLGQVYAVQNGQAQPDLLYDFDVLPGDTVTDPLGVWQTDMKVLTVDTVVINGTQRKRIGIESIISPGGPPAYWIQGIGGNGGLFSTCGCSSVSGQTELVCMTVNDTVQFGGNVGGVGDCSLLLSSGSEGFALEEFTVFPVPAGDQLQWRPLGVQPIHAEVLDMDGRIVFAGNTGSNTLEVDGFSTGAYVLRLVDAKGKTLSTRFVKH
ncbi:MAG: T9SS type A sorting domain-containing protein [Flavobacteriales bacterium]|nr:T9SS type A sorting domain-containing protein [Flavobacteriales bacterium]